jgi:hypothetical protein
VQRLSLAGSQKIEKDNLIGAIRYQLIVIDSDPLKLGFEGAAADQDRQ